MASDLIESLQSTDASVCVNEAERMALVTATRHFLAKIETPAERLIDLGLNQPTLNACLKIALDTHLFSKWEKWSSGSASSQQLAQVCGVEEPLMRRLLLHMVANHIIDQRGADDFRQTAFSRAFCDPHNSSWVQLLYDSTTPLCQGLPAHLRATQYKEPHDPTNGPWQSIISKPGSSLYEYYSQHPAEAAVFNRCMTSYAAIRSGWLDFFPSERLIDDSEAPVLVDMGGNVGHDIQKFVMKHPGLGDRLILQGLPQVVENATYDPSVQVMAHDFFTEQPVKGAKAYFIKGCLHNWSDSQCIEILRNALPAMKPGYSELLINEAVVPDVQPSAQLTALDLTVMIMTSARERSESSWRAMLVSAGFTIVKIWSSPTALQSIIEAEPALTGSQL